MMRFIPFIVAGLILGACETTPLDQDVAAKTLVEDLFAAFNAHDSKALAAFYTEDAQVISPETCQPTIGRAAITANYDALFEQIPDVRDNVKTVLVDGNSIALTFVASSQISGQEHELPIAAFITIEDGLIARDEAYFDTDVTPDCSNP
ncbi:MAG: nuclear transport factor 2 family protein [Pseudomonadota bacterium]